MNPRFCLVLILLLSIAKTGSAQGSGRIVASFGNAGSASLPDVLVTLISASDSSVVKTGFTDAGGIAFFNELAFAGYYLTAEKDSFQAFRSDTFLLNEASPELQLGIFRMEAIGPQRISEVVVSAALPFVQKRADRTVVNPEALISNAGLTALDVLGKSPGVRVNADGWISLMGRPGVVVFIDDRPTQLSGTDLANYLRTLPSSALQSIEIMTNPPAKYDAAGNAGIINIRLKKLTQRGFLATGKASITDSTAARYSTIASISSTFFQV